MSNYLESGAEISPCKTYRYKLWRIWDKTKPIALFIMLNPSTADENKDDATIRRIIDFCKREKQGGVYVGNLSAYRATNPKDLLALSQEQFLDFDSRNIHAIAEMKKECNGIKVLAHGNYPKKFFIPYFYEDFWKCFGFTKSGQPKHPLYLSKHTKLELVNPPPKGVLFSFS